VRDGLQLRSRLSIAAFAVVTLAACGSDETPSSPPLADGRHFGYVRGVDADAEPPTIRFDRAEFLTGDAADAAAVEAGAIEAGEEVPNDYFIRNGDESTVEVAVADEVEVTAVRCPTSCREGVAGEFEGFAAAFDEGGEKSLMDDYRGARSQYRIVVRGGEVVRIDEQYLP
jgi:hypothetical protein